MANRATIERIAELFNKEIIEGDHHVKELHRFRGKNTRKIFIEKCLHDDYAFYSGGRQQTQFNFGFESWGGKEHFRYGMAFSLSVSASQLEPVRTFKPRIARYNELVAQAPERVKGLSMWYYDADHNRSGPFSAGPIPEEWVALGSFIFIGLRHERNAEEVGNQDVARAAELFDKLFPLFKDIERGFPPHDEKPDADADAEERIARVCWNTSNWFGPSGADGKSRSKDAFEGRHGFGLEEWLLNPRFEIDGYRYGYLRPVAAHIDAYQGRSYNVDLYTIRKTMPDNEYYQVGRITNVEILGQVQRSQILKAYRENGWLKEMKAEIRAIGLDPGILEEEAKLSGVANVRFKAEDVQISPGLEPMDLKTLDRAGRYVFLTKARNPSPASSFGNSDRPGLTLSGNTTLSEDAVVRHRTRIGPVQCSRTHVEIQNALSRYLKDRYPDDEIDLESKTAILTQVDCTRTGRDKARHFYEVKTYPAARTAIRDALGQLLEYAHYPDKKMARTLTIVAPARLSESDREYLKLLRHTYGLPLAYLYYVSPQRGFVEELAAAE